MKRIRKSNRGGQSQSQSPPQQTIVGRTIQTYKVSPWDFRKMKKLNPGPPMSPEADKAYHKARVKIMAKHFGWRPYMLKYGLPDPTGLYKEPKPTMRRTK